MQKSLWLHLIAALVLLTTFGCANPAEDAPDAEVQEVTVVKEEPTSNDAMVYNLGDDSSVSFVGAKVTGTHEGGFNDFEGTISLVNSDPTSSSVKVHIDTTSLWSDDERLTGHLKSEDFFDVEKHPTATFETTNIVPLDSEEGTHTVTGNLDLHGVAKQISFPATIEVNDGGVTAHAEFSIKRFDFGIEYAGKADDLIRDEVLIKLHLTSAPAEAPSDESNA